MRALTIALLAWYQPVSDLTIEQADALPETYVGRERAIQIIHYAQCHKNLQFGWEFAQLINIDPNFLFPAILHLSLIHILMCIRDRQTPFINIEASDHDWDNEKYGDNSDTLTSGLIYYSNAINEYPINITDSSAGLQPSLLIYDPGAVMHEGIHGMTNRIYDPGWERPSNIYADLYGTSDDNTYLKYKKKNIERPGYTLKNSGEALRSHRVLKTAFARHLIQQGIPELEVVNRVLDPQSFLLWLDTTVYNNGEGGGFSFPDGIVPKGGEEEYHRAAVGFRPVVGELLGKVKQYNSWQNNDNMPDRLKILTFPANYSFSELPSEERLKVFGEVHPQVRNTRSNNIYNYLS